MHFVDLFEFDFTSEEWLRFAYLRSTIFQVVIKPWNFKMTLPFFGQCGIILVVWRLCLKLFCDVVYETPLTKLDSFINFPLLLKRNHFSDFFITVLWAIPLELVKCISEFIKST